MHDSGESRLDVFVSYSAEDRAAALAVCAGLESRRIRCWIAPRDVPVGATWAKAIIDAITASRLMVLVVSENANLSEHVMREVERAVSHSKPVLPIRIQDVPLREELEYYVGRHHWLDALTPPFEQHVARLAEHVLGLLRRGEPTGSAEAGAAAKTLQSSVAVDMMRAGAANGGSPRRRALALPVAVGAAAAAAVLGLWQLTNAASKSESSAALTRPATPPPVVPGPAPLAPSPAGPVAVPGAGAKPVLEAREPESRPTPPVAEKAVASPAADKVIATKVGLEFIQIDGGSFSMGTALLHPRRIDAEPPPQNATVATVWMATTPVTRRQFESFTKATGYKTDAERGATVSYGWPKQATQAVQDAALRWNAPGFPQFPDHPVVHVTLADALAFCGWMSKVEGRQFDLPTSAEWEWAARAGTETSWPWGETEAAAVGRLNGLNPEAMQWYANPKLAAFPFGDGFVHTSPVKSFLANPWGLFDMHGNVFQWTKSVARGGDGKRMAVRGGAFNTSVNFTRSSHEGEQSPTSASYRCGFRCVIRPR